MISNNLPVNRPSLRVVFDTNVYIAALLRPGLSEELVKRGLRSEFAVIISEVILSELARKLTDKFSFPAKEIDDYLDLIREAAVMVDDICGNHKVALRDSRDVPILCCALAGQASLIVTLDQNLTTLKE